MIEKQFAIHARVTLDTTVVVEADTPEEAMAKFHSGDWVDDGFAGASTVDIDATGEPKQDYP